MNRNREVLLPDNRLPRHLHDIKALAAWEAGYRGHDVGIAIVDSGIDMLEGNARRHLNDYPADEPLAVNQTWAGSKPYDYTRERVFLGGTFTHSTDRREFIDEFGHGTKMATIVGARPGFDGVAGLVPQVRLYNYRVANRDGVVTEGALRAVVEAIHDHARSLGIRVALFALDANVWRTESETTDLLRLLDEADLVTVVAASDTYPDGIDIDNLKSHPSWCARNLKTVLIVAGYGGKEGDLSPSSNFGKERVHLAAPARGVTAASPLAPMPVYGTSAAAALVAGAAALVAGADPAASAAETCKRVCALTRPAGLKGTKLVYGVLDLSGLAAAKTPAEAPAPPPA
jgi:subtilisin family serine protease